MPARTRTHAPPPPPAHTQACASPPIRCRPADCRGRDHRRRRCDGRNPSHRPAVRRRLVPRRRAFPQATAAAAAALACAFEERRERAGRRQLPRRHYAWAAASAPATPGWRPAMACGVARGARSSSPSYLDSELEASHTGKPLSSPPRPGLPLPQEDTELAPLSDFRIAGEIPV
jgi:hypothetical protein